MIEKIAEIWLDMSPYLLLGMVVAGLLHIYVGSDFIKKHIGKGVKNIVKASLLGVPLPVCSCGVIPIASSMRRDGASRSATLSFLVSTPTTGVDSIFATYSLLGPFFAIFRPLFALFAGIFTGFLSHAVDKEEEREERHGHVKMERRSLREALKYAFIEMPEDIGKWLVIGVVAGGIIASIPFTVKAAYPFDMLAALLVSLPLYVCATGSIPVALVLIEKGFSPGAALVFLIAGPATNTVTLSFVRYKLGRKSFFLYLSSIAFLSLLAGASFNFLYQTFAGGSYRPFYLPQWFKILSGIILAVLILSSFLRNLLKKEVEMENRVYVPDMKCRNCKHTIENVLKNAGVKKFVVSLEKKMVRFEDVEKKRVIDAIKRAGYEVE